MTLHELYRGAGMPGLRSIAKEVMQGEFRDTVSHEKVAAMLRGDGVPRWSKLEPVVRVLAGWHTPRLDVEAETTRFQHLWYAAHAGESDLASGLNGPPPPPRKSGSDAGSRGSAGDAGAEEVVRVVGAEVAARARAERQAESERGYRDGVQFAGDLPSWRELEALAGVDFDVAAWIKFRQQQWGRIAARLDPYETDLPEWAEKAARYLGTLADPVGFDRYSFTPTDAYLTGFAAGLRAVWEAARLEMPPGRGVVGRDAPTASEQIAEDLGRLMRGHAGLSLDDVERAGQTLLERLHDRFQHATVRNQLPSGANMIVDWFQAPNCNYGDRPYRLINWRYHGLKIVVTIGKPEPLQAECTPIPGISRARDAKHSLIVIDANRPSNRPLLLAIGDIYPQVTPNAANMIDEWVEQRLAMLLTEFGQALSGALVRLGYDS